MFLTQDQIQEIYQLVDDATYMFIARNVSDEYITEEQIQRLVSLGFKREQILSLPHVAFEFGMLSNYLKDNDVKKLNFSELKNAIKSNKHIPLSSGEKYALQIVERRAVNGIKNLGATVKRDVDNIILENDSKIKSIYEKIITDESKIAIEERKSIKQLSSSIGQRTKDWGRDLDRIADFILHEAYDNGRAYEIMREYGEDAKVYKRVHHDACESCHELYYDNVLTRKPKIFILKELIANGTNIGRKKRDWKAVVGATHPYCRCDLEYVPKGWIWSDKTKRFIPPKSKKKKRAKVSITLT